MMIGADSDQELIRDLSDRIVDLEAEVKRLEGLILDWADTGPSGTRGPLLAEARRIRGER